MNGPLTEQDRRHVTEVALGFLWLASGTQVTQHHDATGSLFNLQQGAVTVQGRIWPTDVSVAVRVGDVDEGSYAKATVTSELAADGTWTPMRLNVVSDGPTADYRLVCAAAQIAGDMLADGLNRALRISSPAELAANLFAEQTQYSTGAPD